MHKLAFLKKCVRKYRCVYTGAVSGCSLSSPVWVHTPLFLTRRVPGIDAQCKWPQVPNVRAVEGPSELQQMRATDYTGTSCSAPSRLGPERRLA